MKKIGLVLLSLTMVLVLGDAHARRKKASSGQASVKKVSSEMAEAWCTKLYECAPNQPVGPKECRRVLKKSFTNGFKQTAGNRSIEVSAQELDQCTTSVKNTACQSLQNAQQLPGCRFISLLNRYN